MNNFIEGSIFDHISFIVITEAFFPIPYQIIFRIIAFILADPVYTHTH